MAGEGAERRRRQRLLDAAIPNHVPSDLFECEVLDPLENQDFRARPVDAEMVRRLACLYMEIDEIAQVIDMPKDQVEAIYGPIIEQGRQEALVALRRVRWRSAMRGNTTMIIHLSEQLLKEAPPPITNLNFNINGELADDDPRAVLLRAVRQAAEKMVGREVTAPLPLPQIAAGDKEF